MKKSIVVLLITLSLVSFTVLKDKNFTISGTVVGIENGKKMLLQRQDEAKGVITIDSVVVNNGKFTFEGNTSEPAINFVAIEGIADKVVLILEPGIIDLTIYKDSISKSRVGGTYSNNHLYQYTNESALIQNKMRIFQKENEAKFTEAKTKNDTVVMNALINQNNKFMLDFDLLSESNIVSHPKSFISVLLIDNMFNKPNFDIQKIAKLNDGIDASLKTTKLEKTILSKIKNYASLNIGGNAPDFSAPNPEGKMTSLKQSLGKITIIDFWASWCGPCRAENPNVLKLYNEFHSKGLNIIGVSLDKEATKWKEAIAKDKLPWIHVSNLKFWEDPIAQLYNIKSIPATYILDSKGKIIAKDLRGEELNVKIKSLLEK